MLSVFKYLEKHYVSLSSDQPMSNRYVLNQHCSIIQSKKEKKRTNHSFERIMNLKTSSFFTFFSGCNNILGGKKRKEKKKNCTKHCLNQILFNDTFLDWWIPIKSYLILIKHIFHVVSYCISLPEHCLTRSLAKINLLDSSLLYKLDLSLRSSAKLTHWNFW